MEGKLKIKEPNEIVAAAYSQKAQKSLLSVKAVKKIGNLEDAVAFSYYAMYHSVLALLFRIGIKCENHTAAIQLLKEVFGRDNVQIMNAKKERIDKQYYVGFSITEEETDEAIAKAEEFLASMKEFLDHLTIQEIELYRKKAINVIGHS